MLNVKTHVYEFIYRVHDFINSSFNSTAILIEIPRAIVFFHKVNRLIFE